MKPVGKPDAGDPHVRFDERGRETGLRHRARPRLYRSRDASGTHWWTRMAERSSSRFTRPTSKIATGPGRYCAPHARVGRSCNWPTPMPATKGRASHRLAQSASRSCTSWRGRSVSSCTPAAGWSSVSSPASTAIAVWQRTLRPPSPRRKPSSTPLRLSCFYDDWAVDEPIRNRL